MTPALRRLPRALALSAALALRPDDDEQRLAARVLELEHRLYPMAVRWFVDDRLRIEGGRVVLLPANGGGPPEPRLIGEIG